MSDLRDWNGRLVAPATRGYQGKHVVDNSREWSAIAQVCHLYTEATIGPAIPVTTRAASRRQAVQALRLLAWATLEDDDHSECYMRLTRLTRAKE